LIALRKRHICLGASAYLDLTGKGRKQRSVPLWSRTARILRSWMNELGNDHDIFILPNARDVPLSRDGVGYVLKQAVQKAAANCPDLCGKKVTPHTLRHYSESGTMPTRPVFTRLRQQTA